MSKSLISKPFLVNYFLYILLLFTLSCCTQKKIDKKQLEHEAIFVKLIKMNSEYSKKTVADSLKYLLPMLDSVFFWDAKYRAVNNSKSFFENKTKVTYLDSINLSIVEPILQKYGILGFNEIGLVGNMALFNVIQHANHSIHLKYRDVVQKAFDQKKIRPDQYAMFEDRILVKQNKKQLYGTQIVTTINDKEIYPIENVDSLEYRRKSIGLSQPYKDYCKIFKLDWDIEAHKKNMKDLMVKYKIKD